MRERENIVAETTRQNAHDLVAAKRSAARARIGRLQNQSCIEKQDEHAHKNKPTLNGSGRRGQRLSVVFADLMLRSLVRMARLAVLYRSSQLLQKASTWHDPRDS